MISWEAMISVDERGISLWLSDSFLGSVSEIATGLIFGLLFSGVVGFWDF